MASVAFAQDQGWRTAVAVTVAVPAEKRKDASASSATLDGEAAIAIYLAKAARTPRDSTSSLLAAQYKVTMKAVRDVWNLRTWVWTTMPYWTRSDKEKFLRKHLCTKCRSRGVRSLLSACKDCAGPRRRGRPTLRQPPSSCGHQPRAAQSEPESPPSAGTYPVAQPDGRPSTFSRPSACTYPTALSRASTMPSLASLAWHAGGRVEPSVAMTERTFGLPSGDAAGLDPWPHTARPAVEISPQDRYGDLDDWLRQADMSFKAHQAQGAGNQTTVVQSAGADLVDCEASALVWALQPNRYQSSALVWALQPNRYQSW